MGRRAALDSTSSSDEDRPSAKKNQKRMTLDKETKILVQSFQPRRVTRSMSRAKSAVRAESPPPKQSHKMEQRNIPTTSSKNSSTNRPSMSRAPSANRAPVSRAPSANRAPVSRAPSANRAPVSGAPSTSYGTANNYRSSTSRAPSNGGRKTPEAVHRQNSSHYNSRQMDDMPFRTIKLPSYDAFKTRNGAFRSDIEAIQDDIDAIHNKIREFANMCPKTKN